MDELGVEELDWPESWSQPMEHLWDDSSLYRNEGIVNECMVHDFTWKKKKDFFLHFHLSTYTLHFFLEDLFPA